MKKNTVYMDWMKGKQVAFQYNKNGEYLPMNKIKHGIRCFYYYMIYLFNEYVYVCIMYSKLNKLEKSHTWFNKKKGYSRYIKN